MDYSGYPEYRQLYPPFEPRVSVIDLILNEGPRRHQVYEEFLTWIFQSLPRSTASALHLEEFYARTYAVAERVTSDFEIILVNDGSPDNSLEIALAATDKDPQGSGLIDLSRNFGHHKTMMTGLMHARGDLVFLLDTDLEEEPELLKHFYQRVKAKGADVVLWGPAKTQG